MWRDAGLFRTREGCATPVDALERAYARSGARSADAADVRRAGGASIW